MSRNYLEGKERRIPKSIGLSLPMTLLIILIVLTFSFGKAFSEGNLKENYYKAVAKDIGYGKEKEQVGRIHIEETSPSGAESPTCTATGS